MNFGSDNWAGVAPQVAQSLSKYSEGLAAPYGMSDLDKALEERFSTLFEREVAVYFVGTGTAANSLALSSQNKPGGVVMCHRDAHIFNDECGAPEFYTGGARLAPIDGKLGKFTPKALEYELSRFQPDFIHHGQPMGVSITQATEWGTCYQLEEVKALADVAHAHNLPLHMDGARFANAMVHLDATPAEMTWKSGVDILSFGGTKNGCWCAEAVVFFDPQKARELPFMRKRAGHLFSKTRFIAAQFHAYLDDDLWLDLARHANSMAAQLADGIKQSKNADVAWDCQSNEVFAIITKQQLNNLREAGAHFYEWNTPHGLDVGLNDDKRLVRLVSSFSTSNNEVVDFVDLINT